jgi:hypothetical protein
MQIDFQEILNYLSPIPTGPVIQPVILFSLLIYIIFILALITLFVMPDKNLISTLLTGGVLMAAVLAKLITGGAVIPGFRPAQFGVLIINVLPFLFPFLVAGMTRTRKRSNPVIPLGILTGIFGGVYFFLFWFIAQRGT